MDRCALCMFDVEAQQVKDTRGTFKRGVSRSSIEEIQEKTSVNCISLPQRKLEHDDRSRSMTVHGGCWSTVKGRTKQSLEIDPMRHLGTIPRWAIYHGWSAENAIQRQKGNAIHRKFRRQTTARPFETTGLMSRRRRRGKDRRTREAVITVDRWWSRVWKKGQRLVTREVGRG